MTRTGAAPVDYQAEARRLLAALHLEVPRAVVDDVVRRVGAALERAAQIAELRGQSIVVEEGETMSENVSGKREVPEPASKSPSVVVSTAITTYDGRTVVDARRLLGKPHVKKFIQSVSSKVRLSPT